MFDDFDDYEDEIEEEIFDMWAIDEAYSNASKKSGGGCCLFMFLCIVMPPIVLISGAIYGIVNMM